VFLSRETSDPVSNSNLTLLCANHCELVV
jgi:hypothetical protein